jgi:hypothetical protein
MKTKLTGTGWMVVGALMFGVTVAGVQEGVAAADAAASKKSKGTPGERVYQRTDKLDKVWVAEGFNFSGYDLLVVDEARLDASVTAKDEKEEERLALARGGLARNFALSIEARRLFGKVTTDAAELSATGKVARLEPTILKFSRGSSAARFGVGFGAGMPYIKVGMALTDVATGAVLFEGELDERADWIATGFTSSRTLQSGASVELTEDVAEFMQRVARGEKIKYKKAKD